MLKNIEMTDNSLTNSHKNGTIYSLEYDKGLDNYDDKK